MHHPQSDGIHERFNVRRAKKLYETFRSVICIMPVRCSAAGSKRTTPAVSIQPLVFFRRSSIIGAIHKLVSTSVR